MARFHATVLTLAAGAVLGSALRPGLPEVALVAAVVCGAAALYRRLAGRRVARPA